MPSVGLFRGDRHVIDFMSQDIKDWIGWDPVGLPVDEAFPEPSYRPILAAMTKCYETGRPTTACSSLGTVKVRPTVLLGRVIGVEAVVPSPPSPQREPLPPLVSTQSPEP